MPRPSVNAVSAVASGTASVTATMPGHGPNDIIVLMIESANQFLAQGHTNLINNGFTQLINTGFGTAATAGGLRGLLYWKRQVSGTQGSVVLGDFGDHTLTRSISIKDANTTLTPIDVSQVRTATSATTSLDFPAVTTTKANTLIMLAHWNDRDAATTTGFPALTNGNLSNITERMDNFISSGAGGGIGMATADYVSSGNTGNTTGTLPASNVWITATIAFFGDPDPTIRPKTQVIFV